MTKIIKAADYGYRIGKVSMDVTTLDDDTYFYVENGVWWGYITSENGNRCIYAGVNPNKENPTKDGNYVNKIELENNTSYMAVIGRIKRKIITSIKELENYVYNEYKIGSTELDSSFLNVSVNMKEKDILTAYRNIQSTVNGDSIVRLLEPEIEATGECEDKVFGIETDLIEKGKYEEAYSGNCKDFLKCFNGSVFQTGICRLMNYEKRDNGKIGGVILEFMIM